MPPSMSKAIKSCLTILLLMMVINKVEAEVMAPTNDDKVSALELTLDSNGDFCSSGAEYTNVGASADVNDVRPANWTSGPNKNVWFKFKPNASGIANIRVSRGGAGYLMSALYDGAGNEVISDGHGGVYDNSVLAISGLTPDVYYYLEVDSHVTYGFYGGTFSICISSSFDNNFKDYALELPLDSNGDFCSNGAEYTNVNASVDVNDARAANWTSGPNKNVWFKFKPNASGIANIRVSGGGARYLMSALYDGAGNEVISDGHGGVYDNSVLAISGLTPDVYYYLEVDSHVTYGFYGGTFSICISSSFDNNFKDYALELPLDSNGDFCSNGAEYTNVNASVDVNDARAANWTSGPNKNVWFKFKPNASGIANIRVSGGGARYLMSALYDGAGNEVISDGHGGVYDNSVLAISGLTPDVYYYLEVDSHVTYGFYGGTFSICISSSFDNNFKDYALELPLDSNGDFCSNGAEYTNVNASVDVNDARAANWTSGPNKNVWFKFKPNASGIANIRVSGGGARYLMSALYDGAGNEVISDGHGGVYDNSVLAISGLTPDVYYYLEVDSHVTYGFYGGTFSICISSSFDNNFKDYALELPLDSNGDFCSNGAEYTNVNASVDVNDVRAANWTSGPNKNVWFKFKPNSYGSVDITISRGSGGYFMSALYDAYGNELASAGHGGVHDNSVIAVSGLTAGADYYLGVDSHVKYGYYGGSFSICIDYDSDFPCRTELWAIASGDWGNPNIWSANEGGQPVSAIPCETTVVYIKGFDVSFNSSAIETAKRVEIIGTNANTLTRLNVQTGQLNVKEEVVTSGAGAKLQNASGARIKVTGQ